MAKMYTSNVSVIRNTKGQVTIAKDDDGKFNMNNTVELYKTMTDFGKKLKAEVKLFKPEPNGDTPVILSDRWGNPYMALLPAKTAPGKVAITKLA